jgi:hypothetical protein
MKKLKSAIPEKYEPHEINKCIYCGSVDDLTDEHIVPYSLGGPWQLLHASCKECAKITMKFEREVTHDLFRLVRTKLDLPTYHPKKRPESFKFTVKIDKKEQIVDFSTSDSPLLFVMPVFKKPGYLLGQKETKGISFVGMTLHGQSKKELADFAKEKHLDDISYSGTFGTGFARFLAKIAYGMVVEQYGLDKIEEAYVLPAILGKKDDVGQWVGCENPDKPPDSIPKGEFFHNIEVLQVKNEVGARIHLFGSFQTPIYLVIVGRLKTILH